MNFEALTPDLSFGLPERKLTSLCSRQIIIDREAHPGDHAPIVRLVGREVHVVALWHAATHQKTIPGPSCQWGRNKIEDLNLNNEVWSNKHTYI